MSDSGRYLGYKEDVERWNMEKALTERRREVSYEEIKAELNRLEAENERLKRENADLRQQVRDLSCHPLRPNSGPIHWCDLCGNPVTGMMTQHICK